MIDVRIVEGILLRGAVCIECLARDLGISVDDTTTLVDHIERTLIIAHEIGRCAACDGVVAVDGIRGTARFPFGQDTLLPDAPADSTNSGSPPGSERLRPTRARTSPTTVGSRQRAARRAGALS